MKKLHRLLLVVLCLTLCIGCLSVFGGCETTTEGGKELIVFTMFGGDDANKPAYQKGVDKFLARNQGVKIEDQSIQAVGEGFDSVMTSKFVSEKYAPDVLYVFSPGRNIPIQNQLAKVADIRQKYPDYGKGFPEVGGDPTALAFLGNTFGIFYENSQFTEEDFASYSSLRAKLKSMDKSKLVDATGEMNTWFNYIGLQVMGKKWADVQIPDKNWFVQNKNDLISVLEEMIAYCHDDLGMGADGLKDYGAEKESMWNGNKSFDVNGNWNANGWYEPNSSAGKGDLYSVRNFVVDDNPDTKDIDESKYVMAGFFHGWMISKKCFNDPQRLKLAVDFVNAQCESVMEYGALAANGSVGQNDNRLVKQSKELLKKEGGIMCSPLDDKFVNPTAKKTLYDGLKNLMLGSTTPTKVIEDTISAFDE